MKRFLGFYAVLAYLFLYAPLAVLGVFSFNSSKLSVWHGFTLDWYASVFHNPALAEGTVNSLLIAVVATIVSTLFGTLAAYALWKQRAAWLTQSLYLSLLTPEIVTGVSLMVLFQWIFRFLHLHLGMPTVILAHISFSIAYVVIVILARLRTFDVALEEAALDLGANEWQVFLRIYGTHPDARYSSRRTPMLHYLFRRLRDNQSCSRREFGNAAHDHLRSRSKRS